MLVLKLPLLFILLFSGILLIGELIKISLLLIKRLFTLTDLSGIFWKILESFGNFLILLGLLIIPFLLGWLLISGLIVLY